MKILLSYPRSGNHLVRFFIELLSELPTFGHKYTPQDVEIYKNIFEKEIPFNISKYDKNECYQKFHNAPNHIKNINELILIVRNPQEVLLNQNEYKLNEEGDWYSFQRYFDNIDYYNNFKGKKLLLFYEDILTNKIEFINMLYEFLNLQKKDKKKYVLDNIEELYMLSLNGKGRSWGGNNSNNKLHYYYEKIPQNIKEDFDKYIKDKMKLKQYLFVKSIYNL